jgi:hypothetical protein
MGLMGLMGPMGKRSFRTAKDMVMGKGTNNGLHDEHKRMSVTLVSAKKPKKH